MHRIRGAKRQWCQRLRYRQVAALAGLVLLLLIAVFYRGHVVSGAPVLPADVAAELAQKRAAYVAAYRADSDIVHQLWLAPDPTQIPIPIKRPGQIVPLDAGKLRGTQSGISPRCTLEIGGTLKKLKPDHRGYIAVEYTGPPLAALLDAEACESGAVTLVGRKDLNYFIGAEVLR